MQPCHPLPFPPAARITIKIHFRRSYYGISENLLGLGVAAGTAYAAVKVAQKYNEKKNANADLNGDGAVDANDTVYGVKEAAREVYAETAAKVREKAPEVREKAAAAIGAVQEKPPSSSRR